MVNPDLKLEKQILYLIIKKSEKPNSKQDRVFLIKWAEERIKVLKNEKSLLNDKETCRRINAAIKGLKILRKKLQK